MQWLILAVFLVTALLLAKFRRPSHCIVLIVVSVVMLAASRADVWFGKAYKPQQNRAALLQKVPEMVPDDEYVSSETCQACHPGEYESWHKSFHRTMTQVASPESVYGDFDDVRLQLPVTNLDFRFFRRGDEFFVEATDPQRPEVPPHVEQVVMATGSHHYQVYWGSMTAEGKLINLPFVYLLEAQRWATREQAFLMPPDRGPEDSHWNSNCVACHSTRGRTKKDGSRTQTVELGIACEACHGGAAEHVRVNNDPRRRYRYRAAGADPDPTIVNPARLSPERSSEVCAYCHSVLTNRPGVDLETFRPGDDLNDFALIVRPRQPEFRQYIAPIRREEPNYFTNRFWPDGMVRVAGREYNGMIESACFQKGELSCLSCHSLHESEPNDQLAAGMRGNEACLQCHSKYRTSLEAHTHHAPDSEGSKCYNCHMPHTVYGLLQGIRSHLIDSPTVASSVATGRPNACNHCHVDKSLGWTQKHLANWYGTQPVPLKPDQTTISATLLHLLKGDAAQRALAAWAAGWQPAQTASGAVWLAPFLAPLLEDPYAVVRYIAGRSLRRISGYEDFTFDYVASPETLSLANQRAVALWESLREASLDRKGPAVLIDTAGQLDRTTLERLRAQRDDRPIQVLE